MPDMCNRMQAALTLESQNVKKRLLSIVESVDADQVSLMLNSGLLRMVRPTRLLLPAGGALASNAKPAILDEALLSPRTYL